MPTADLTNPRQEIITGNDNIVIVDNFQSVRGGRTLDVTEFNPTVINAGHVIIKSTTADLYKPMPLASNDTVYGALPSGYEYAGILIQTLFTAKPFAGIMLRGTVNYKAAPFDMTSILTAIKTALPLIKFVED